MRAAREPLTTSFCWLFLRGISTRQVGQVLEPILGEAYSAQTISNITRELNHAVQQFHRQPLRDDYVYLFLDGVVLKVRDLSGKVHRRWVLVAYGALPSGKRQILAYHFAQGEAKPPGWNFCRIFICAACMAKNLKLIVTDGGKGLRAALPVVFPCVPQQLCWATSCATSPKKFAARKAPAWPKPPPSMRQQQNQALLAFRLWRQAWQHRRPNAVACVERDLEHLLSFFSVPESHWKKVRTTNVIERASAKCADAPVPCPASPIPKAATASSTASSRT